MARAILVLALAVHAAGAAAAAWGELKQATRIAAAAGAILAGAWMLELAALVGRAAATGAIPLRSGAEYLFVLGWLVLGLHLALWYRSRIRAAALVLPPVAAAMIAAALLLPAGDADATDVARRGWFVAHTAVATAGMGALAVSFAMGVLFLAKEHALKSKSPLRVLERLPSLETIDRVGFHALLWGFPLLTLGIATGMVFNAALHGSAWTWGLKEIFPLLAWIVFGALLWARVARGERGRRSAVLAITGFALGVLTFVGMAR